MKRDFLADILKTFVFSLSQGMAESSKYPGARGTRAGQAASLQAPMLMAQIEEKRKQDEEDRQLRLQQIQATIANQQNDNATQAFNAAKGSMAPETPLTVPRGPSIDPRAAGQVYQGDTQMGPQQLPAMNVGGQMIRPQSAQDMGRMALEQARQQLNLRPPAAPEGFTLSEGQTRFGPNGQPVANVQKPASKEERDPKTGTTIETAQGIMQWNPTTQRYDIPAGNAPPSVSTAQPDYEWIVRDGKPLQIRKGASKPGDAPYSAAATSPSSEYSQERAVRTLASIDELLPKVSNLTVGPGSLLSKLPEPLAQGARNFASQLQTLKTSIATGELAEMRNASKTGGALGNVSDRELNLLESSLGALDTGQDPENFKAQLKKIQSSIERWEKAKVSLSGPKIGDIKTFPNGKKGKWDGTGWEAIP